MGFEPAEIDTARPALKQIAKQRKIVDRRALNEKIADLLEDQTVQKARPELLALLQKTLADGREEIARRLRKNPSDGHAAAAAQAFLVDQLLRAIFDLVVRFQYPVANPSAGERIAMMAVGGYGRGEMAPHSDVDIGFVTPFKGTSWTEQVVEAVLYWLWDLGFTVGQSSRSLDEVVRMAREDLTIRTALLEGRYIWGDSEVYEEAKARFFAEVVNGTERDFVVQKLAERDDRHKRMGDSRYVVEPNVKDGKGGLRDLQTLYWIGKYIHRVTNANELVEVGLMSEDEFHEFSRAANFLWAVRCHLHDITGRAEERLTFDLQREVAKRMRFADRKAKSSVERFMQYYFLNAKSVGDLTGLFLAHLDEQHQRRAKRILRSIGRRTSRKLEGFVVESRQIKLPEDKYFEKDPVRLLEIFHLADAHELEIHPTAMRAARRDAKLIDNKVRRNKRANGLFLDILCSPRDPEQVLRWMNEAGVFGRFVPDFGKVVAQMQFDMYHHYTVDEHTIRAIGLLAEIEAGQHADDHPYATNLIGKIENRRVLYVATLLHDIAKGRGGDHSILGAEVAMKLCPRLGLKDFETELVAWLVRNHLLMSATAFKRDLSDPKTIEDFVGAVKSMERLRLLSLLTTVDIRAVGPGTWNSWKRQLLRDLFGGSEEVMRLGHKQTGRKQRVAAKRDAVGARSGLSEAAFGKIANRLSDAYWIAESEDVIEQNVRLINGFGDEKVAIAIEPYPERGATLVTVYAADHPGLFYRIIGGIHLAGALIIDARIHTTRDGMALDNFLVQDRQERPFEGEEQFERLRTLVRDALVKRAGLAPQLEAKPLLQPRASAFKITPLVIVDNSASNRFTVVEVNAQDRPALLYHLAYALFESQTILHSAHITTYGERAVDTFYLTDLLGFKIEGESRVKALRKALIAASEAENVAGKAKEAKGKK